MNITSLFRILVATTLSISSFVLSLEKEVDGYLPLDLSPFLQSPLQESLESVGCLPIFAPISKNEIDALYTHFNQIKDFTEICSTLKSWAQEFAASEEITPWSHTNYRFGIFDQSRPTHKETRLIEGVNCKICREYYDWVHDHHREELASQPAIAYLFEKLMAIEAVCQRIVVEKIAEIAQEHPKVNDILYHYKGQLCAPLTIRLIRFGKTGRFCLPLHYDTSIISLIFPSDDDPLEECLVVAPIAPLNQEAFDKNTFRKVIRPISSDASQACIVLITGTLLPYIGIPIFPTPHAVLPHNRPTRSVITVCCHIPNLNTSGFNSLISFVQKGLFLDSGISKCLSKRS